MIVPAPTQTTYQQYETVAQNGMTASTAGQPQLDPRILEEPTGNGVGFGLAVCQGYKSDKGCTLGALSGGAFVGITHASSVLAVATTPLPSGASRKIDTFYDTDTVPVQTFGDIWVQPLGNVASGNPAYFNSVTGQLGGSGIANAVLIEDSIWMTSLPNSSQPQINFNGLAVIRLTSMA
jgi:hypothetical protein